MSHNLILESKSDEAKCELMMTPTFLTSRVLRYARRYEIAFAYLEWVEQSFGPNRRGAYLDHQVDVLKFLVRYPDAEFKST